MSHLISDSVITGKAGICIFITRDIVGANFVRPNTSAFPFFADNALPDPRRGELRSPAFYRKKRSSLAGDER